MLSAEHLILVSGILLLAGVIASRVADRFGVPALLVFLAVGMLAGSEGVGGIAFDSAPLAQSVGTVALMVILFTGGLDTDWRAVRPVFAQGLLLATVGVAVTALLLAGFAWIVLGDYQTFNVGTVGVNFAQALLLAAIVSSTDAAAVFSVFRSSTAQPRRRIRSLLEFESGSNDPMAVLLTVTILGLMTSATGSVTAVGLDLLTQFAVGALGGCLIGLAGVALLERLRLSALGLYPILALAVGMVTFGAVHALDGNGFLAVYAAGLVLGNRLQGSRLDAVRSFHDGLSWMFQIAMFVVLGLLVFPSRLPDVAAVSIALALFLMFVARPISVVLCLAPFRPRRNELAYVSWVGLRGSVPIVLATFPATYGVAGAGVIFDVVFFIVLTSVLLQGLTLAPCARWLDVLEREEDEGG